MHTIENWSVVLHSHARRPQLLGLVFGHTAIPDGLMLSSFLHSADERTALAQTENSVYLLGQRDPVFDRWLRAHRDRYPRVFRYERTRSRSQLALPQLEEIYADEICSIEELAQKWLTKTDWDEILPGVPMDWLTDGERLAVQRALATRTAERMRAAAAAHEARI
jgi:hypothetical protein